MTVHRGQRARRIEVYHVLVVVLDLRQTLDQPLAICLVARFARPDHVRIYTDSHFASPLRLRSTFAGTPPTIAYAGTFLFTTAPAATTEPRPIVTPSRIMAPEPIQQSSSTTMPWRVTPCCLMGTS